MCNKFCELFDEIGEVFSELGVTNNHEPEETEDVRDVQVFVNGAYTTAVENGHLLDGISLILKRYPWVDMDWLLESKKFFGPDKIVAKVKCHKDDTYDEATGRSEAIKKLNHLIIINREKIVKDFESYIRKQMECPASKKTVWEITKNLS